jgi:uncharacterized protein DUF397
MTEDWRKSSWSAYNGNCVEVRIMNGEVQVRDSKNRAGAILGFAPAEWAAFLAAARHGMN